VTLDELRADPDVARTASLEVTATLPAVPAPALLGTLGTTQVTGGTVDGTVVVRGTIARPTVSARLAASEVSVPEEAREPVPMVQSLRLDAAWDGAAAAIAIHGEQTAGGRLRVRATGRPDALDAVQATLHAHELELAPLVAFMPGPAGGIGGRMNAELALSGADPRTATASGFLRIVDGRIPIAPMVGTLFEGDVHVSIRDQVLDARLSGRLGRGDVQLVARAPLEGVRPSGGIAQLTLREVQLIGRTQPILTGAVVAELARVDEVWRARMRIDGARVRIPPERGVELAPIGPPDDFVLDGEPRPERRARRPAAAIADVIIRNTQIESEELRGVVGGRLRVTVDDDAELGLVGELALQRGVLDLFRRRYTIDHAALRFDGTTDPLVDVRIAYDFPDVTTITEVSGRLSDPDLMLSSSPATYSQTELLGFLLGGEPRGPPEIAPSATERVVGAGTSFLAGRLADFVTRALPVDIDVLRYEAATATTGAAVTVGTWITDTLFLAYRRNLEARPDENAGQAEVQYWIRRRLVVEGVVGDRGVSGVDLLWRRRW
jgi:autotransporter translocation and assembly factor TamB